CSRGTQSTTAASHERFPGAILWGCARTLVGTVCTRQLSFPRRRTHQWGALVGTAPVGVRDAGAPLCTRSAALWRARRHACPGAWSPITSPCVSRRHLPQPYGHRLLRYARVLHAGLLGVGASPLAHASGRCGPWYDVSIPRIERAADRPAPHRLPCAVSLEAWPGSGWYRRATGLGRRG